jgi:hypothetical protein
VVAAIEFFWSNMANPATYITGVCYASGLNPTPLLVYVQFSLGGAIFFTFGDLKKRREDPAVRRTTNGPRHYV